MVLLMYRSNYKWIYLVADFGGGEALFAQRNDRQGVGGGVFGGVHSSNVCGGDWVFEG